ncbi:PHP domain-containing protein, partial [Treponema sp.]|uniref:PHP domain-containing protein n=1 Tax=Treponema sp. TaxID=166 RepID=UPI0025D983C2
MIDLHTHSTASDGTKSPSELVRYAFSKGINIMALTDHDTTAGIEEAKKEAAAIVKEGHDFIFIPGIELNIQWPTGEFHLLGLGLKETSPELKEIEDYLEDERKNRNIKMAEKLQAAGINITIEEVEQSFNTNMIGRPHFADCMVKKGFVKTRQEAFDRYFAKGRPCYTDRKGADLEECCRAIKSSGGIPVQAHPMSMYVSWGKMEETLRRIRNAGVMGLEAWHP